MTYLAQKFINQRDGGRADDGAVRIGRAPGSAILLDHAAVSSTHAEIRRSGGTYTITDLGSATGTYVGSESVGTRSFAEGELAWVGPYQVFVRDGAVRCVTTGELRQD